MESIVSPKVWGFLNKERLIPRELFTKNHKDMRKDGEQWMKETATSCIVVGALIVTIMFAAIFTVLGGNDQNNGFPISLNKNLFMARMLFACFPRIKKYFFPLKYIENKNKNIFNKFLIVAPTSYFFKNYQVLHPHPNPKMHLYFIGNQFEGFVTLYQSN